MNSFQHFTTLAGNKDFWFEVKHNFLIKPKIFICHADGWFAILWTNNQQFHNEVRELARAWARFNKLNPEAIVGQDTLIVSDNVPTSIPGYDENYFTQDHKRRVRLMFMDWVINKLS